MAEALQTPEAIAARAIDILERLVAFDTTSRGSNLPLIEYVEAQLAKLGVEGRRVPQRRRLQVEPLRHPRAQRGRRRRALRPHRRGAGGRPALDLRPLRPHPSRRPPLRAGDLRHEGLPRPGAGRRPGLRPRRPEAPGAPRPVVRRGGRLSRRARHDPRHRRRAATPFRRGGGRADRHGDGLRPQGHRLLSGHRHRPRGALQPHPPRRLGQHGGDPADGLARGAVGAAGARGRPRLPVHAQRRDPDHRGDQRRHGREHPGPRVHLPVRPAHSARPGRGGDPRPLQGGVRRPRRRAQGPRSRGGGEAGAARLHTPPLAPEPDSPAERLARRLAGDNGPPRVVPYAAEAGQFQEAGFSTVICGPGSIDQAHQPDEYVEVSQMERGAVFMARLVEALRE